MKNYVKLALVIFYLLADSAMPQKQDDLPQKINEIIKQERLFQQKHALTITTLEFRQGMYVFEYHSAGRDWYNSGKYSFAKNAVFLKPEICAEDSSGKRKMKCNETMGDAKCELSSIPNSFRFSLELKCTSDQNKDVSWERNFVSFPIASAKIPMGKQIIVRNKVFISMGGQVGKTRKKLHLKVAPAESTKSIDYLPIDFQSHGEFPKFVPPNTPVKIYARTMQKETISGITDYWFNIDIGALTDVWLFGNLSINEK